MGGVFGFLLQFLENGERTIKRIPKTFGEVGGVAMWLIVFIICIMLVVTALESIYEFVLSIRQIKNAGDEEVSESIDMAIGRIHVILAIRNAIHKWQEFA